MEVPLAGRSGRTSVQPESLVDTPDVQMVSNTNQQDVQQTEEVKTRTTLVTIPQVQPVPRAHNSADDELESKLFFETELQQHLKTDVAEAQADGSAVDHHADHGTQQLAISQQSELQSQLLRNDAKDDLPDDGTKYLHGDTAGDDQLDSSMRVHATIKPQINHRSVEQSDASSQTTAPTSQMPREDKVSGVCRNQVSSNFCPVALNRTLCSSSTRAQSSHTT